jgi:hypothetical protein
MSFLRHREIFRSDVSRKDPERTNRSGLHRLDEFPVGYSLASCAPAVLASAWPTVTHSESDHPRLASKNQPAANYSLTCCLNAGAHPSGIPGCVRPAFVRGLSLNIFCYQNFAELALSAIIRADEDQQFPSDRGTQ